MKYGSLDRLKKLSEIASSWSVPIVVLVVGWWLSAAGKEREINTQEIAQILAAAQLQQDGDC